MAAIWGAFVACGAGVVVICALPMLPAQDWPGHVGLVGGLAAADRLPPEYFSRGWVGPNRLFYALALAATALGLEPLHASQLVLATSILCLVPAVGFLARAAGGSWSFAVAAVPIATGPILFSGFAPNVCALVPFAVGLGAYLHLRRSERLATWSWVLAASALAALGFHAFVFMALLAILVVLAGIDVVPPATRPGALATLATLAVACLAGPWLGQSGGGVDAVLTTIEPPRPVELAQTFWEWSVAPFSGSMTLLQAAWMSLVIFGVARARVHPRLLVALASCALAFVVLPETIGAPMNWWGARQRVPALLWIVALAIAARGAQRSPWLTPLVAGVSAALVVSTAVTSAGFSSRESVGFDTVRAAIRPDARLCTLAFSPKEHARFRGAVHWYVGNYARDRGPIWLAEDLSGHSGVPLGRRDAPARVGWGGLEGFDREHHGEECDHFLVRIDPARPSRPLGDGSKRGLRLRAEAGLWRLYVRPRESELEPRDRGLRFQTRPPALNW